VIWQRSVNTGPRIAVTCRNPDDRWIDHSDVVSELVLDLQEKNTYGGMRMPACHHLPGSQVPDRLMIKAPGEIVLDAVEMMRSVLFEDRRDMFTISVNHILKMEDC
jgi:hypothetical protein